MLTWYQATPNKVIKFITTEQGEILSYKDGYYSVMCPCCMVNSELFIKPRMWCIFCETTYAVKKGGGDGVFRDFWSKMQSTFIKGP